MRMRVLYTFDSVVISMYSYALRSKATVSVAIEFLVRIYSFLLSLVAVYRKV